MRQFDWHMLILILIAWGWAGLLGYIMWNAPAFN